MINDAPIRDLLNRQLQKLNELGIGDTSKTELLLLIILLNFLSIENRSIKGINLDFDVLIDNEKLRKSINDLLTYSISNNSAIPIEVLELNIVDFEALKNGQFYEMVKEWRAVFDDIQLERIDILSKIFELLEATLIVDYKGSGFMTPHDLATLASKFFPENLERKKVYDPYARTGEFLSKIATNHKIEQPQFYSSTRDKLDLKIAKVKMFMMGVRDIRFELNDNIPKSAKTFDYIISNPPFGTTSSNTDRNNEGFWINNFSNGRSEIDFLCHILDHLSDTGMAVVIVPAGILSSGGKIELLRERMIKDGILEVVVALPTKIFYNTGVASALLVFNKSKKNSEVLLINATTIGQKEKTKHFLSDKDIESIIALRNSKNYAPISQSFHRWVAYSELEKNNYDFQTSAYEIGEIFVKDTKPVNVLSKECQDLELELITIQKSIWEIIKSN